MSKKLRSISVHMRLDPQTVGKLDLLASSTGGSRTDVVKLLVRAAELEERPGVVTVVVPGGKKRDT